MTISIHVIMLLVYRECLGEEYFLQKVSKILIKLAIKCTEVPQ